jgi:hypothetical protein
VYAWPGYDGGVSDRFARLAAKNGLPAMSGGVPPAHASGEPIAFGPNVRDDYRRTAALVDKTQVNFNWPAQSSISSASP